MWLADTSIKRPVFATMVILALVVLGSVSYPRIGVDLFPRVDFPIVNIRTNLKGASPEIMDIDVTDKIEAAVNTVNGVKTISSLSSEGSSSITVEFFLERDIDLAVQDVREKISAIRSKLPRDIDDPVIEKVDPDANPVMWLALTGEKSARELSSYADEVVREQIQRIYGVGAIRFSGMRLRQIRVWLDAERMSAYGLTARDVADALSRENVELPGGRIEAGTKEYSIKIEGELRDIGEFNSLVVAYRGGAPVRLRDIGRAEDGMEERRSIARFNGVPAVGMGIQKQSGTNTVEVVDRIKEELKIINETLPPGMSLGINFDQSLFIKRSIREVQHHLIYGGLFASLAVLLFLKSIRVTLISALAIPVSIISTFSIMNMFDFTFNNMSMLGLSLSIGILIDDAIIVIENIQRHIEKGMTPMEAASSATSEIGLAVMATTLAIVVIFLPVAFMKGVIGMFFMQFALTVIFSVMVSLLVSFTLTPMLASRFLRKESDEDNRHTSFIKRLSFLPELLYGYIEAHYRRLLATALNHRVSVIVLAVLSLAGGIYTSRFLGKEMAPPEDQSRFVVRLTAPIDYSIDESDRLFRKAEEIVRGLPEVRAAYYSQSSAQKANMFVTLAPRSERKRGQFEIMAEVRKEFRKIPGLKGGVEEVSLIGGGQRQVPIQYSIRGTDLKSLTSYTGEIAERFSKLPGVVDLDTSLEMGKPEARVFIDRDRAAALGVDISAAAETINILIGGEMDVTRFKDEAKGRRYDVRMRLNPEDRTRPQDIGNLYVRGKNGNLVQLSSFVKIEEAGGPPVINRLDRQRAVTLFANLEGKPLGEAKDELDSISASILPPDYSGRHKGMADMMGESFQYLKFALILGIILAYMVLASQFESFAHPFTVLLSMPFAFIGAFGALLVMGMTLNIFSFIGIILLMGLVKKNAILLVDYTNTLRSNGMQRREAIMEAGPVRLRPILMTTFAMVFGMMPVALGLGEGSETRAPMAVTTIGGLMTSLLLTLVVVPVVYDLIDEMGEKIRRREGNETKRIG